MDHESVTERMFDLHRGRLDAKSRGEIEAHLAGCADCRSFSESYEALHRILLEEAKSLAEHPSSHQIVAFANRPADLTENERLAIESHVGACDTCQSEVSSVRDAERDLSSSSSSVSGSSARRRFDWKRPEARMALAASILFALVAYPAFLGVYRLPQVAEEIGLLRNENDRLTESLQAHAEIAREWERSRTWSGSAGLSFVRSARRDRANWNEVPLTGPFVVLGVDLGVPQEISDTTLLRFVISKPDGPEVVSVDTTAGQVRHQIRSTSVATLVISSVLLDTGRYRMRVNSTEPSGGRLLLDAGIEFTSKAE